MFGLWQHKPAETDRDRPLLAAVAQHMPEADEQTVRIVAAIAGLLGQVAYADQKYTDSEERRIREELSRIQGLSPAGVDAVCDTLELHLAEIATVEAPWHARALRDLGERDLRLQVLDLLVDVAAADDEICIRETNVLRHTASALGLTQDDYNAAQERHKSKLRVLR